ncbi:hypothetical protein MT487_09585 [Lachnospiraceae bacterium NSJ-171]|nr:hypothetical protein [Lachnospiraceae bacterium NSJ-171]
MKLKDKLRKNKEAIRFFIIIFFFVGGYVFFFSSTVWMPASADASYLTNIGEENKWEDRYITINRWQYSENQHLMEVDLTVDNKSYDGINKYKYSAVDLMGNVLKCEAKIEEDNWIVLRISDIPKKWSDISLRLEMPDGKGNWLKLYTNIVDVEKVAKFDNLDRNGYQAQKFNIEIKNMQKEIQKNNKQINKLNDEIAEVQKEIERINKDKLYQTESEQAESDSLIADANSTIASKQKQIQELIADTDEINKRIEMKNREKTDLGI